MAKASSSTNSDHRLPNLNNYTPSGIVDICGPYQQELGWLNKLTKYLKAGLHARLADTDKIDPLTWQIKGDEYTAVISTETFNMFDQDKAREFLTEKQIEECMVTQQRKVVRFIKHPTKES